MPLAGLEPTIPAKKAPAQARLRPCSNWNWCLEFPYKKCTKFCCIKDLLNSVTWPRTYKNIETFRLITNLMENKEMS